MEDVDTIYAVPAELAREGLDKQILRLLRLEDRPQNLQPWIDLVQRMHHPTAKRASPSSANTSNSKMPTRVCAKR